MNRFLTVLVMVLSFVCTSFAEEAGGKLSNATVYGGYKVSAPIEVDSLSYYKQEASVFERDGSSKKTSGIVMLVAGVVGVIGGVSTFATIVANDDKYCSEVITTDDSYQCNVNEAGLVLMVSGMTLGAVGGGLAAWGGVRIVGGSKMLRTARTYRRRVEELENRELNPQLSIKPEFNPFANKVGAVLALSI